MTRVEDRGLRILIADDIPANLDVLRRILEREGYNIYVAPNGKVLMDLAFRAKPDLILLDIMMPDLNSLDACRNLKQNPSTRNIPVIFVSAKSDGEEIEESFSAGAADFIHKPFKQTEVLARVKNQLEMRKLERRNSQLVRELESVANAHTRNGLADAKFIHDFIRWEAFRYQRQKVPFSIILASVELGDQLKGEVKEKEWDQLTQKIGAFFRKNSRKLDCAGLWEGGERFLILLPGTELKGAIILARKFAELLPHNPITLNGRQIPLLMSFGVNEFKPTEKEIDSAILQMIHEADTYLGKAQDKKTEKIAAPMVF
ncbi:MAG: response regulator [Nitrospinota bacterium]|nr:response regulator [Nitrospinota bacterium]